MVIVAYWTRIEAVLFVVCFMFPLLLAFQELAKRAAPIAAKIRVDPTATDALTGLASRAEMLRRLSEFLEIARNSGGEAAVLYIDIDQFSRINGRFGMAAGDAMLTEIGQRISDCVRDSDLVARVDGDEYAVVLFPPGKVDTTLALALADRIGAALAKPFAVDRIPCFLTSGTGVCMSGRAPMQTAESVLDAAATAMAHGRRNGPGLVGSFSPKMRREAVKMRALAPDIDAALDDGQIRPWFQPQICTDTGEIAGFEALARWEHSEKGVILPGMFLKAIANAGKSARLGEVVLYHSLSALRSWDRAGLRIASVGVNFSSTELRNPKLVEKIKWEVDRFDITPARLTIEILEDVVSDHDDDVIRHNVRALAAHGFGIDLDDFGTGHAAIANIRRFAVNRIKIDRSFVTRIDEDSEQQVMTGAIIRLAESLGLETLAEGVETVGEHNRLAQLGCRYIQGFGVARPMRFEDTIAWMHQHRDKLAKGSGTVRRAG